MIMRTAFPGDINHALIQVQHDLYNRLLWFVFQYPRDRYLQAIQLAGVDTELATRLRAIKSFDHRILQDAHDKIAEYYRFAYDAGPQPMFPELTNGLSYPEQLATAWTQFFHEELKNLTEIDDFVRSVLTAVAYQNTETGDAAETLLRDFLQERYGNLEERARLRLAIDKHGAE